MDKAILLAVAASLFTATSSVCQRLGASRTQADRFDLRLIVRLARRPVWLAGIGCMILGFACQVSALRFGALALVQPILALELLFVFAYMAVLGSRRVQLRDWLAAFGMSAGLALFLLAAAPSGGRPHAPGSSWWLAGLACAGVVLPLAASQPGFTILDPLAASLLGIFLFGEHMRAGTLYLAAEAAGLALVVAGVAALSHSHLIQGENQPRPGRPFRGGRAARAAGPIAGLPTGPQPKG